MSSQSTAMETHPQLCLLPQGAPASFPVLCVHMFGSKNILKARIFILRYPDFSCFILISVISQDWNAENIPLEVFLSLTSALSSSHQIPLSSNILQPPPGNLPLSQAMTLLTKCLIHRSQLHPQVLQLVSAQATQVIHAVENFFARNPILIHLFSPVNLFPPTMSFHSPYRTWKLLQEFSFTSIVLRLHRSATGENLPLCLCSSCLLSLCPWSPPEWLSALSSVSPDHSHIFLPTPIMMFPIILWIPLHCALQILITKAF